MEVALFHYTGLTLTVDTKIDNRLSVNLKKLAICTEKGMQPFQ